MKPQRFRIGLVLALAGALTGVPASSASADVTGPATLSGVAEVGGAFVAGCPKTGVATVAGNGLGILPGQHKNAVYHLKAGFSGVLTHRGRVGNYVGVLEICGWLTTPLNLPLKPVLGGSCISTKGQGGRGEAFASMPGDAFKLKLFNFGWKASLAGIHFFTADYQEYTTGQSNTKKAKFGSLAGTLGATVVAPDGITPNPLACLTKSAEFFTVTGKTKLTNDGAVNNPDHAKNPGLFGPKKCVGEPACPVGPGK